jgi:hypothetical protein
VCPYKLKCDEKKRAYTISTENVDIALAVGPYDVTNRVKISTDNPEWLLFNPLVAAAAQLCYFDIIPTRPSSFHLAGALASSPSSLRFLPPKRIIYELLPCQTSPSNMAHPAANKKSQVRGKKKKG